MNDIEYEKVWASYIRTSWWCVRILFVCAAAQVVNLIVAAYLMWR
jgi:hypothetical protein